MYICPECGKEYQTETQIQKHFLACWKDRNPHHISKEAPHSGTIETKEVNNEVLEFFSSLRRS